MPTQTTKKAGPKLTAEERRRIILEVLSDPNANLTQIAREHGIDRNSIYGYILRARQDPKAQWHEAEAEAAFRKKVYDLLR